MDCPDLLPRISADRLRIFISLVFEKAGLPSSDARILGELITEADLRGTDTHGVFRLPLYVRRIKAGGINLRPNIRIVAEQPATALVYGDNAMGHLVMHFAARVAIEKARQTGVGWVGARMSNHAGPAALYAMMALAHDMVGLYFAVGSNVDIAVRAIRESQRLPGVERVWLPGEQSHNKRIERLALGIPIPSALWQSLDGLARELNVVTLF